MIEKYESPVLNRIRKTGIEKDLGHAYKAALEYTGSINKRRVFPGEAEIRGLSSFEEKLSENPVETSEIINQLHTYGSPATVAQTGGRYFGFVCGGVLPSSLAARWLADSWDQNGALYLMSPVCSKIEEITEKWIAELLGLPEETAAGFVSGSSTATIIGLAAGRNFLLKNAGYDIFGKGLVNAPGIKVVIGEGAHSTVFKALSIIGLGNNDLIKVPGDDQGRIKEDLIPEPDNMTLLVLQAGNVNSGSFDRFENICRKAKKAGSYVHIDGAFGLWAAACKELSHLTKGIELADSWSVDGHKTLNTPYDSGIILSKHRELHIQSMHMTGSYIAVSDKRDSMMYTAEMSRRARAVDAWAALKGLGRKGVSELVYELHSKAVYFADLLKTGGLEILNNVVFNQILVRFETDEKTEELVKRIQESGVCWMGGSKWQGKSVIRISVSSYRTTYEDIDVSAEDILRLKYEINIKRSG